MTRQTTRLRFLISSLVFGLVAALGILYLIVEAVTIQEPAQAGLRWPIYISILIGTIPWFISVKPFMQLLTLVDKGEAYSIRTLGLLKLIRLLFASTAIYLFFGFFWLVHVTGGHPGMLLILFAGEVVLWFVVALIATLERVFEQGVDFRVDTELTV
jgi:hypothetical protein